jgi:hypothetical protein
MADSEDLLKLPPELRSDGDPVEGNPFSEENVWHQVWKDTTREAEDKLHLLQFNLLQSSRGVPEDPTAWRVKLAIAKFDIWAKRNLHVVWDDAGVREYDKWLESYANGWTKLYTDKFSTSITLDGLMDALRLQLIERIELWKSIARRFVAEQQKLVARVNNQNTNEMRQLALDESIT